jgi:hypothetical protein
MHQVKFTPYILTNAHGGTKCDGKVISHWLYLIYNGILPHVSWYAFCPLLWFSPFVFFCKILILFLVHMVISVAHLESCFLPVLTLKVCHSDILILMAFVSLIL